MDKADLVENASAKLLEACKQGDDAMAQALLGLGANPRDAGLEASSSPLALALRSGNLDLVERLAAALGDEGPKLDGSPEPAGVEMARLGVLGRGRPFHAALLRGRLKDVDDASRAWLSAAVEGDVEGLRKARGEGADVDALDHQGLDALMLAAFHGNLEAIDTLLEEGWGDPSRVDKRGHNALAMAMSSPMGVAPGGERGRCALRLCDVSDCDSPRVGPMETLLSVACAQKQVELARALMERSDPNAKTGPFGGKAIVSAALYASGSPSQARQLIEALWDKTDLQERDDRGRSAWDELVRTDLADFVRELRARKEAHALEPHAREGVRSGPKAI